MWRVCACASSTVNTGGWSVVPVLDAQASPSRARISSRSSAWPRHSRARTARQAEASRARYACAVVARPSSTDSPVWRTGMVPRRGPRDAPDPRPPTSASSAPARAGSAWPPARRSWAPAVVLIERGAMGGDCLNVGCVPSKSLIAAAAAAHAAGAGAPLRRRHAAPDVDFAAVRRHVHGVIDGDRAARQRRALRGAGRDGVCASGHGSPAPTWSRRAAGKVRARRFVVATGSRPAMPPVPGLAGAGLPDQRDGVRSAGAARAAARARRRADRAASWPRRSAGWAAEVVMVDQGPILPRDDPELAEVVRARLLAEGVRTARACTGRARAEPGPALIVGRRAAARLRRHPSAGGGRPRGHGGWARTRGRRRRHRRQGHQGRRPAAHHQRARLRDRRRRRRPAVHPRRRLPGGDRRSATRCSACRPGPARARCRTSTFTDPELAAVGPERGARRGRRGCAHEIVRWPFADNDRARAERATEGLVKVVAGRGGRVLGAAHRRRACRRADPALGAGGRARPEARARWPTSSRPIRR